MAAPMDLASVDAIGVRSAQRALVAAGSVAAADARANAARRVVRQSQAERNAAFCEETVAIGIADAARQFVYLKSGKTVETHESARSYVTYVNGKLTGEKKLAYSTYKGKSLNFFALAYAYGETTRGGVTIERDALDSRTWKKGIGNGQIKYAELSTLEFVLQDGFADALLEKIQPGGKSVTALLEEAANKPKAATRRPKKAAAEPAETTEAAETTPPKAKAPARRPRRRGRRREDDDDDDDFAPPPKAKAEDDDEIKAVVGEAAPAETKTAKEVLLEDNKNLRRDLAARDEEIAALKESLQKHDELLKKKEDDQKFVAKMTIIPLKKALAAAVRDELAREMAKNKILSAAVCPRTSPLCDATNT